MPIARIHVNRNLIRSGNNNSRLNSTPVITVKWLQKTTQFYSVLLLKGTAIHGKVLSCGATAYMEADTKDVLVYRSGCWQQLENRLLQIPVDSHDNNTSICHLIDRSTAVEFAFDSRALAANRAIDKIRRQDKPYYPAIKIATPTHTLAFTGRLEFSSPLQLIQSHPNLNSRFLGEIVVFGLINTIELPTT